jgi:anti-sigma B factor antagonist
MAGVEVRTRVARGHFVVELRGELDAAGAAGAASAVAVRAAGGLGVIVDLAGLDFLDCCALRALAGAGEAARRAGGFVVLAGPRGLVLRLLDVTGLPGALGVHPSVAAAVRLSASRS